jgi:hypothetical protein
LQTEGLKAGLVSFPTLPFQGACIRPKRIKCASVIAFMFVDLSGGPILADLYMGSTVFSLVTMAHFRGM